MGEEKAYSEQEMGRKLEQIARLKQQNGELSAVIEILRKQNDMLLVKYLDLIATVNINGWGY